jgi:hypothetical protein
MFKYIWSTLLAIGVIGGFATLIFCHVTTQETTQREVSDKLQQVLTWLPADTETISVARGPFTLEAPPRQDWTPQTWDPNRVVPDSQLAQMFEGVPLLLLNFKNGSLFNRLQGKRVALAVEGSRHFRAPAGLGMGPFEGCTIVVFDDDLGDDASSLISETRKAALRVEEIQEQKVSIFQEKSEENVWTMFVAFPNRKTVLVASDRNYLIEVLTRLHGGTGKLALPNDLPEWKYVDTKSQFWGLRHYDWNQAKTDPTLPFGGRKSADESVEKAIGITFVFDPSRGKTALITYLSGDKSNSGRVSSLLAMRQAREAKGLNIGIRELAPGVTQGSYTLEQIESTDFFISDLIEMFGPAIYI